MSSPTSDASHASSSLPLPLAPSTTALLVCDVQETFRAVIPSSASLIRACAFLSRVALALSLPATVVSQQYTKAFGPTVEEIRAALPGLGGGSGSPASLHLVEKTRFSMVDDALVALLRSRSVASVVLCGLETHICVAQTARDLARAGFLVHVCADAVASQRGEDRSVALRRMELMAGVWLTTVEAAAFDLLGDARAPQFRQVLALVKERNEWHAAERAARRAGREGERDGGRWEEEA